MPNTLITSVAVALGAAKATNMIKQVLRDVGLDKVPPQAKAVIATTLSVVGSVLIETTGRRRLLVGCASAGLASLAHSVEQNIRAKAALDEIIFLREAPNVLGTPKRR